MNKKAVGSNAERQLLHLFWANNWATIRVAGSGSSRYPSPDLVAGKGKRKLAIECKAFTKEKQYITRHEVTELEKFAKIFGAEPWIAVRFTKKGWFFFNPEDLSSATENIPISFEEAKAKALTFEEITQQ